MKRKYLVILSLILCISLGLSSVSAAVIASDNADDINTGDTQIDNVGATSAPIILNTSIDVDKEKIPATKESTVTAKVYATFNDAPLLVKTGIITLYINGEKEQSIDLAETGGVAVFKISPLLENRDCKIKYEGGYCYDPDLSENFEFNPSEKTLIVGDVSDAIPTTIKVVPSKITGYAGDMVKFSAKVVFTFNDVESIADEGHLYFLKDGKTVEVVDLSKNSNPTFSFKLEKGHKYSLMYDGAEEVGEMGLNYAPSDKDLNVQILDQPKNNTNVDMENTGAPLAVLLIALLGLPLYFRRK